MNLHVLIIMFSDQMSVECQSNLFFEVTYHIRVCNNGACDK